MQDTISVLLIDDAEPQYYLIDGFLQLSKSNTFRVDWTSSLEEALQFVRERDYDICLLDYDLGHFTGVDVLRRFHEEELDIPVVVLTGYGSHDVDIAVMEAGAVDYIDKTSLNAHVLERTIRYTVQQSRNTKALKHSEVRFRAMVEKGSDLIIQLDNDGYIIYVSPSISRILGYTEFELLKRKLQDYVHEADLPTLFEMFMNLNQLPENSYVASYRIRSQDGNWLWFESVSTNLLSVPGIHAIIVNARDITERRRLLESEQERRVIAQALLDTSNALNSTLNLDDVLSRILENVGNVIPHDSANVMMISENRTYAASYRGYEQYTRPLVPEDFCFQIDQTPTLDAMARTHEPMIVSDVQGNSMWRGEKKNNGIRSYIGMPIIENEEVIGFINLDSAVPNFFTEVHAEYLRLFANQAAIAIRNAHAYQQAQKLAALEERQRLARELHDAVSQTLFSASVIADSLTRMVSSDADKLQMGLEKLTQLNRGALAEMRALLVELRPQAIVNMPLPELLENLARGLRGRANIEVELDIIGTPIELDSDVHLQFYRLAQEILTNAHKHAKAGHIQVELRYLNHSIDLAIADDGIGFNPEAIPPSHHGIHIMYERAAKIGAAISVESAPGEGTYIHVKWPA